MRRVHFRRVESRAPPHWAGTRAIGCLVPYIKVRQSHSGKLFACELFAIEPDVLCIAKAVTGGYGGLGAVITTSRIANAIKEDFGLYSTSTYGWHPRAVAVALANL